MMDPIVVASDKDSNDQRKQCVAGAWEATEQRVLWHVSLPPPSPTLTAADAWRKSNKDFHLALTCWHYVALHSLGAMFKIRLGCATAHTDFTSRAHAVAKLRAHDLASSILLSLKGHTRKEAEDKHEHQVKHITHSL
ncbi:hypothetical protein JCM8097_008589 [Rhodosporidiobolus ruineniae]